MLTRHGTTLTLYVNGAAVATLATLSGLIDIGATAEGRRQYLAIVSSPENLIIRMGCNHENRSTGHGSSPPA